MNASTTVVRCVQTCRAYPSQWDLDMADGTYVYVRYRHGWFISERAATKEAWSRDEIIDRRSCDYDCEFGDAGTLTEAEMLDLTGFVLGSVPCPKRLRVSRRLGGGVPDGAVYVGRPGKWGNPFPVRDSNRARAVELYREHLRQHPELVESARAELKGVDLACWCPLDGPCHADVLLEVANQ